jgi:hypothetical protein
MTSAADPPENVWLDEEAGPVVRPYAMTRGRTRPSSGEFDLIALIVAIQPVAAVASELGPEQAAIIGLCQHPTSVAEISAHLDLPVGIVRVLLGDLLDSGFILTREPRRITHAPSEPVLKAVINGLRSL